MRHFFHYWFVAAPKLTLAQAYNLFYRFIRFAAEEYTERGWYNQSDDEDPQS